MAVPGHSGEGPRLGFWSIYGHWRYSPAPCMLGDVVCYGSLKSALWLGVEWFPWGQTCWQRLWLGGTGRDLEGPLACSSGHAIYLLSGGGFPMRVQEPYLAAHIAGKRVKMTKPKSTRGFSV